MANYCKKDVLAEAIHSGLLLLTVSKTTVYKSVEPEVKGQAHLI